MINKTRNTKIIILFLIVNLSMLAFEGISNANTYYASSGGTAPWTQCTNINTPCSAATVMSNAQAGDIVYFRGGTYTVGQSAGSHGILEPSNSGTSGNPITFQAYPGEIPIMDATADVTHNNSRALGNGFKNYIVFDGFTIQANGGVKMGGIFVGGVDASNYATGCIVRNNTFIGGSNVPTFTDNLEGLRIDFTHYTQVYQNTFTHYRETNDCHNTSAVKTYNNDHLTFRNNEISDCSCGLYLKRATSDSTISYNYIHNNHEGGLIAIYLGNNSDRMIFHDNVWINNSYGCLDMDTQTDGSHADDWQIYNNTLYGSARGISWMDTTTATHGAIIYNNIVQGASTLQLNGAGTSGLVEEDYNQWGTASFRIRIRIYQGNQGTYASLASWQASTDLASGGHPGTGDLASDPSFQNGSGNLNRLNDFKLAPNSPCKGTGKGGVDMGANIDLVGVRNSSEQKIPAHPGNLK